MSLTDVTQILDIAQHLRLKDPQTSGAESVLRTLQTADYSTFVSLVPFKK
jgi:hypothetical protein